MASELDITCTPTPQPQQIRLDTTTACNAKCDSCHRFTTNRKGVMSVELYTEIINDVARWEEPLFELIPVNYGEFFLYEHWFDLLNLIKEKLPRTRVAIPTNGSLIDEETIKKLITIPQIWVINFSINAFFKETYESFMGLPAENMDRIHRTVMRIKTLRPDITIRQSMVFDPRYSTDLERDLFEDYWGGLAETWILPAASAGRPDNAPLKPVKIPCRSIFTDFVIGFNGKLSSCCFDAGFRIDLGEYSGNALKDWKNTKIEELRKLHNEHKRDEVPLCKSCTFA